MDPVFEYLRGQMHPHHAQLLLDYEAESAASVARLAPELDIPYGPHPRERFDFFRAAAPQRGVFAYFHAGYWQARDKFGFRFIADALVVHGIDVAVVNYPLCPDVTLAELTEATRRSVPVIAAHAGAGAFVVGGHSAGGHIAVELGLATPEVTGILALSGVYQLEPLLATPLNEKLRLDPAEAQARSPYFRAAGGRAPALFAVGGLETPEFQRQTTEMHAAWQAAGNGSSMMIVEGADHFTLLRVLTDPASPLFAATLGLFPENPA